MGSGVNKQLCFIIVIIPESLVITISIYAIPLLCKYTTIAAYLEERHGLMFMTVPRCEPGSIVKWR
jgi:hypothetical protein